MKINGYENGELPIEEIRFFDLAEVGVEATPEELRKLATFLQAAADNMERMGTSYTHEHLSDKQPGFEGSPHFVVFNSELSE
ncbi:Imm32 family immunity protein [Halopseudomonas salegens]|uniref:Uncharacterized protein n=1 Tax=Halopseudomonas salegens TaxID=1434072 RepID=A0A1H2GPX3_9GAMM|nr:hypothetical protein [Halopseudomonas salegens]SDU21634.1 hypothetical protein SAMN05216210_2464 [Halopseudomonas salegens]